MEPIPSPDETIWLARNKIGWIETFYEKPVYDDAYDQWVCNTSSCYIYVKGDYLPELTFENSPMEYRCILKPVKQ